MSVSKGAKRLVFIIFMILGLSFWATTGTLIYEFYDHDWFAQLALYSHLFVFFPTFGVLALFAFYVPAVVFTDFYWEHVKPAGRIRFVTGFFVLVAMAIGISWIIRDSTVPTFWELSPATLEADKGEPANCGSSSTPCQRASILEAIAKVRSESQSRNGLSKFIRICKKDELLEEPVSRSFKRHCFASGSLMNADQCCQAQKQFVANLEQLYTPDNYSITRLAHAILLPFKAFFLLMLFLVGLLLAFWRNRIQQFYTSLVPKIERGVIVGALAVLFFPAANHGFLQSASVTYGPFGQSNYSTIAPLVSIAFGAWTVMLMFFFFSRLHKDTESMMRIIGILGSAIAVFQYDAIINYAVRFIGAGSDRIYVLFFVIISIVGIGVLYRFGADEVSPDKSDA